MSDPSGDLLKRIDQIKNAIALSAAKSGRKDSEIRLIAVTKTVEADRILEAYGSGLKCFGENRVQELNSKRELLPDDIEWHMIGRLQTNKVKQVLGKVALIQSLDREDLAREIEAQAERRGIREVPCLVEINSSGEASKAGFTPEGAESFFASFDDKSPIRVKGLMTIGPFVDDEKEIRKSFSLVRSLAERFKKSFPTLGWDILSMGMTHDFEAAIEEGATMVRIGSAIFGARG